MATLLEKCNNIKNDKDTNLKPENLKAGITCLGVTGKLEEGIDTSDATAGPYDMAQGTSAYVNGEKVEGALPVYEAGDTVNSDTVQYLAPEVKIRVSENCILHENSAVVIDEVTLANSAQIDSNMIMSGNQVLGVYGTATEDADATDEDLLEMKTAYSRGQRIYGTIGNWRGTQIPVSTDSARVEEDEIHVYIHPEVQATGYNVLAIDNDCGMEVTVPNNEIAESIGLTSDMIIEGNTVLGVEGTGKSQSSMNGENSMFWVNHAPALDSITPKGDEPRRAIVCSEPNIFRYTAQPTVRIVHFPSTITLESPAEDYAYTEFIGETDDMRTVVMKVSVTPYDNSATIYFEGDAIEIYESNGASIKYITEDGLTYTRNDKECVLDGLNNLVDWTFYSPAAMNGPNGYPDVCSYFVNHLQADEHVMSDTFDGIYYYDDNVQHWVKEPLPVTADECDVKADQLFVSMHGLMHGANKTSGSYIKLDDNNIINIAVLQQDYVNVYLDDVDYSLYGKVVNYRLEGGDTIIASVDVRNDGSSDLDLRGGTLACTLDFYDADGEQLPEGNFYQCEVEGVDSIISPGSRGVLTLRYSSSPSADNCIMRSRSYKMSFQILNPTTGGEQ